VRHPGEFLNKWEGGGNGMKRSKDMSWLLGHGYKRIGGLNNGSKVQALPSRPSRDGVEARTRSGRDWGIGSRDS
jgi:hypothetical protein